jgi:uncharacterized protein YceH (UPF0502 family)
VIERRILGVLIEKQKTSKSADAYPMTLNSLTTGCNQKSNRDPVLELDEDDVEETLRALQAKGLTLKIVGGRADRYKHLLYDVWKVSKVEMAILAELLLRGPQSEGDLRSRASRMEEIADLDVLRGLLKELQARQFVQYLTPADRRGAILTHTFHAPEELEKIRTLVNSGALAQVEAPVRASLSQTGLTELEQKLQAALQELAELRQRVEQLEARAG